MQLSAEAHTEEGKGEEEATQTECRKLKEDRGLEPHFTEDLQTLLFGQLCPAALQESKIKIKDPKMSVIWPL